jgi:hypothetical protein
MVQAWHHLSRAERRIENLSVIDVNLYLIPIPRIYYVLRLIEPILIHIRFCLVRPQLLIYML